jgi:UDP-glucose 4-epimerase
MQQHEIFTLVFSSSAAVYGDQDTVPIPETAPLLATSPYGRTKVMCEQILQDLAATDKRWQITLLRYFNPVGAHSSGKIGENPSGVPQNLLPYIARVADGTYPVLNIFSDDYPTKDGTGIRDYIHVVDLAQGHIAALSHTHTPGAAAVYNLGSGTGYSVYEMLHAFEKAVGHTIPAAVQPRRPGDPAESYASIEKAAQELDWVPRKTLDDICTDAWRWQLTTKK